MTTRRNVLLALSAATFTACAGRQAAPAFNTTARRTDRNAFPQGVASGDPTPDSVVLWTRMPPDGAAAVSSGIVEVSTSADFASLTASRRVDTSAEADFTVRVVIEGLEPDARYYFRFVRPDGATSPVGRTRTAPTPDMDKDVRFAFASCQNYQTGWYHAYRRLIEEDRTEGRAEDLQFLLFLGDFIYEEIFEMEGLARDLQFPDAGDRPSHAVSLEDYRFLYRTYLSDPDLQEARASWPFISIWDDHEFSNNSWQSMETYALEPKAAQARKLAANQAWFEYIPARLSGLTGDQIAHDFEPADLQSAPLDTAEGDAANLAATHSLLVPRRLRWGKRIDMMLTDSRSFRSQHAIPPERAMELSFHPHAILPVEEIERWDAGRTADDPVIDRPPGTMWGERQRDWLFRSLQTSDADWKICALSVPMSQMSMDYTFAKGEIVEVETAMNIDAFDGYPYERRGFLQFLKDSKIANVVSLTGDHHMHFASVLGEGLPSGPTAVEFAVAGVSSTNYFRVFDQNVQRFFPDGLIPRLFSDTGPKGERVAWLNSTILYGYGQTAEWLAAGEPDALALARAPRRLNSLRYLDTDSYGVAIAKATPQRFEVDYLILSHAAVNAPTRPTDDQWRWTHVETTASKPELSQPAFELGAPFPHLL